MKKSLARISHATLLAGLALALFGGLVVLAEVNSVTPSTNELNQTNGSAHVDQLSEGLGTTDLEFVSTKGWWSCFEYRTDGDTTQVLSENGGANYNTSITDGLYPYVCEYNSHEALTITAREYVEVRMVFGAEADERFDWTRFDVIPMPVATDKGACKDEGWQSLYRSDGTGFRTQGDCIQYVNTGK